MITNNLFWDADSLPRMFTIIGVHTVQSRRYNVESFDLDIEASIYRAADRQGVELEKIRISHRGIGDLVRQNRQILLKAPNDNKFLLVVGYRRVVRKILLLSQNNTIKSLNEKELFDYFSEDAVGLISAELESLIRVLPIGEGSGEKIKERLCSEYLDGQFLCIGWYVSSNRGHCLLDLVQREKILVEFSAGLLLHGISYALTLFGISQIVYSVLSKQGSAMLPIAIILLASAIPFRKFSELLIQKSCIKFAMLSKKHVFKKILGFSKRVIDRFRQGELYGFGLDLNAIDTRWINSIFLFCVSVVETCLIFGVTLYQGNFMLLSLLALSVIGLFVFNQSRLQFLLNFINENRKSQLTSLVDRTVGFPTSYVQGESKNDSAFLNNLMSTYSRSLDKMAAIVERGQLYPKLIFVLLIIYLYFECVFGDQPMFVSALGISIFFSRSLLSMSASFNGTMEAIIVLRKIDIAMSQSEVEDDVTSRTLSSDSSDRKTTSSNATKGGCVLRINNLECKVKDRSLFKADAMSLQAGDKVVLTGQSGSGKSSLVSMLAGLDMPPRGKVLINGSDIYDSDIDCWRSKIVISPQFHDNYIFSGTLLYNLLMGRTWPASTGDIILATSICHKLGLEPLIKEMPSGIHQMIGAMGWRLSHGERSRIHMARSLLQSSQIAILDESLSSLDPTIQSDCLDAIIQAPKSFIIVLHP